MSDELDEIKSLRETTRCWFVGAANLWSVARTHNTDQSKGQ